MIHDRTRLSASRLSNILHINKKNIQKLIINNFTFNSNGHNMNFLDKDTRVRNLLCILLKYTFLRLQCMFNNCEEGNLKIFLIFVLSFGLHIHQICEFTQIPFIFLFRIYFFYKYHKKLSCKEHLLMSCLSAFYYQV